MLKTENKLVNVSFKYRTLHLTFLN